MSTDEASCSDCKMEIIERKWAQLLLNWMNRCGNLKNKVLQLENRALTEVLNKYRDDVGSDDLDYDVEHLVRRRYPILRLRYLSEDIPKRLYMMASILLFHCCTKSQSGSVDSDICRKMSKHDQEWILKFCENLSEMEATINNVDSAIREAYEFVSSALKQYSTFTFARTDKNTTLEAEPKDIDAGAVATETGQLAKYPGPTLKFKSSITVMPSVVTDTSSSKSSESDYDPCSGDNRHDVTEDVPIFNFENFQQSDSKNAIVLEEDSSEMRRNCKPGCACSRCSASGPCCGDRGSSMVCYKASKETKPASFLRTLFHPNQCPKRKPKKGSQDSKPCSEQCSRKSSKRSSEQISTSQPGSKSSSGEGSEEKFRKEVHKKLNQAIARKRSQHGWPYYFRFNWRLYMCCVVSIFGVALVVLLAALPYSFLVESGKASKNETNQTKRFAEEIGMFIPTTAWICEKNLCQKVYKPKRSNVYFTSLSRCTLLCMRPQIWPHPIGYTYFSKQIVALSTNNLEYRFQSVPSDPVQQFLAEAFKLFLGDLVRLERIDMPNRRRTEDLSVKKLSIQIDVETDPDPRLRLNTEESYTLKIETISNNVVIKIVSASFCGVRHGLETLSQVILLDQSTGYLITLSNIMVKDAPSYKYRGLMIDTARNYIPVPDLMRTIDAMATCKLNTFHWRITDVTSFPLYLQEYPLLFEYGAYDKSMIYTEDHITAIVHRAGIRGIRVLIEVASPGPVGRAWSWSPDANCQKKNDNFTCNNILCLRLKMQDSVFDILQRIYAKIIELTKVEDVFHLSNGVFSLSNCYYLIDDREGFLDKALERLKLANKGFLPTLPLVWYTTHLTRDRESRIWDKMGVQLYEWLHNSEDHFLSRFRAVHSSRWDLSCEIKKQRCLKYRTWQEMYAWKAWRNLEVFTIEGGEAMLWTDLVDSGNLDYHLWPRAVAVAERLWSDTATNATANCYTYARLDAHRWRMLLRGIRVQPIWPVYCSFNPTSCSNKIKN